MKPTRRTQPYRALMPRSPGAALNAMMRGTTTGGINPQDVQRQTQRLARSRRRAGRPQRPARPKR